MEGPKNDNFLKKLEPPVSHEKQAISEAVSLCLCVSLCLKTVKVKSECTHFKLWIHPIILCVLHYLSVVVVTCYFKL